ncbi:hypothetical protein [Neobacillus sp. YIM B06451]|uniref:hypothetical protein n=1 Tax=Neobacillus sp. YIM B06451 TaxID=3070994 RepID=UPI002930D8B3|nr:hypothetical protein [Neobacillus sp. YIM B06451]
MAEVIEEMPNVLLLFGLIVLVLFSLLSPKNKMTSTKKNLYLLSLISTIFFALIPEIGYQVRGNGVIYFGFPAEAFEYRGVGVSTFRLLGLIFNFLLFYWFFKLLLKLWKALTLAVKKKF